MVQKRVVQLTRFRVHLPDEVAILNCLLVVTLWFKFSGGHNFFCSLARLRMYLPEGLAILNGSGPGGKRNVLFRGLVIMFC